MPPKLLKLFLLFLACSAAGAALAQPARTDTLFIQKAVNAAAVVYKQAFGRQLHLFNGPEYVEYRKLQLKGHPFFESDKLTQGDVYYDGALFEQVPVLYDVVTDEVMTNNGGALQKLLPGKLHSFTLHGHHFVRYVRDSMSTSPLQTGYYDLLHHEEVIVLAKRAKDVQERVEKGQIAGEYQVIDKYYIGKDGYYYSISSRNALLNVFPEEKKQLRKHLQAKKLNFNRNKEATILEAARFYATQKQ